MSQFPLRYLWLSVLINVALSIPSVAQKPVVTTYRVRVITNDGDRFKGTLEDINDSYLYFQSERSFRFSRSEKVPLASIRKVVIRSTNNKPMLITGAIVGALGIGYLANKSLIANPARSPVAHGLTVTFAAVGGAAAGLILGSAVSRINHKVIRPTDQESPETSLIRQLEPFTLRYQQDVLNRLPKTIQ